MERTITVRGAGKVSVKPNYVVLTMDVLAKQKIYTKALAEASAAVDAIRNAAVSAGHAADALKTADFKVTTDYVHERDLKNGGYKQVLSGYICTYKLRLSFDFDREILDKTLNAIEKSKTEPDLFVNFTVRDGSDIKTALLEAAATNAREKAEVLCRASGVKLGTLLSIDYNWNEPNLRSVSGFSVRSAAVNEPSVAPECIDPEEIRVSDTATFVWEIL